MQKTISESGEKEVKITHMAWQCRSRMATLMLSFVEGVPGFVTS